jgi:hypothetical protein
MRWNRDEQQPYNTQNHGICGISRNMHLLARDLFSDGSFSGATKVLYYLVLAAGSP